MEGWTWRDEGKEGWPKEERVLLGRREGRSDGEMEMEVEMEGRRDGKMDGEMKGRKEEGREEWREEGEMAKGREGGSKRGMESSRDVGIEM